MFNIRNFFIIIISCGNTLNSSRWKYLKKIDDYSKGSEFIKVSTNSENLYDDGKTFTSSSLALYTDVNFFNRSFIAA